MPRVIPVVACLFYAFCASATAATPGTTGQLLGPAEDFIARVHAGSVDLATFDFAAAGYWNLPGNDRYEWLSKTNVALIGPGYFMTCSREGRQRGKNEMWMLVLAQSRNAASWSENATALRTQLHILDLAIYDAIGATGVTPASTRTERLRRRVVGNRIVRDERLDAHLVAELPRPAVRYWSGLKATRRLEIDCANTDWLRAEVEKDGWFDIPVYGRQADADAWRLLDDSNRDFRFQKFQREMLARLEALPPGATNATHLAKLHDEVAVSRHQLQRYGTAGACFQRDGWFLEPLEEPAGVDARRARVGLGPLAEFVRTSKAECERIVHPPVKARPSPRT